MHLSMAFCVFGLWVLAFDSSCCWLHREMSEAVALSSWPDWTRMGAEVLRRIPSSVEALCAWAGERVCWLFLA